MKTISAKLKTYREATNIISNDLERSALKFVFWSFGVLAVTYVFLLGSMVSNIIERRSLEAEARVLSSEVAELELAYLSMSGKVDLAYSRTLGFKETQASFATRRALGASFGSVKVSQNDL